MKRENSLNTSALPGICLREMAKLETRENKYFTNSFAKYQDALKPQNGALKFWNPNKAKFGTCFT